MGSEQELNDAIRELAVTRSTLSDVLSRIKLYRNAIAEANIRIYAGELWRIDPEGGELLEPLRVALERAKTLNDIEDAATDIHPWRQPDGEMRIPAPVGDEWCLYYADMPRSGRDYLREWKQSAERAALVPDADRQMERR